MNIAKILPSPLTGNPSRIVTDKREDYDENRETILDKITKNFGFIIIGMMLVGAVVWTLIICV